MQTRLFARLEARIKEDAASLLNSMGDGACHDYPAYRWNCGYLQAMKDIVVAMEEIEQQKE